MKNKQNINFLKYIAVISLYLILIVFLPGCTVDEKCTDIRLKIEEDEYLDGWLYVKDITSLNNESNPIGRILFSLYVNEENPNEYAVLKITKLTVPDSYNGKFVQVTYDEKTDTAMSIDKNDWFISFDIIYDQNGITISADDTNHNNNASEDAKETYDE